MRLKLVTTMLVWVMASTPATAQTIWPNYVGQFAHAVSESPVSAVLPDLAVLPPASGVSPNKARWSGVWSGWACQWQACDVKLAVENVTNEGASIVYAGASDSAAFAERAQALFVGDELKVTLSTGTTLSFRIRSDGKGLMEFVGYGPSNGKNVLRLAGVLSLTEATLKTGQIGPLPPWPKIFDKIPTPFIQDGKLMALEMVVFKPEGNGPFPTLMFNHGSTGNGDNPALFTNTYTSAALARFFTDRGWLVAFPQRRGRGKSDGLYDEGFEADRSRYSCEPELTLPGLERALADMDAAYAYLAVRPDVDPRRMLIGGVSRGGIAASVYAGTRPPRFVGALNFVGGWIGDVCPQAAQVNTASFRRAAGFLSPMLWLYGENDPYYKISHSKANFDAFVQGGGKGEFKVFNAGSGRNGHAIVSQPDLWDSAVNDYLKLLGIQ